MPPNSAAWLVAEKAKPLQVKTAPYTSPGEDEILVKNAAVAINPADQKIQSVAPMPFEYPIIPGADVAGEVVEVGKQVSKYKVGDRVLGCAVGLVNHKNSHSGFQEYTVIRPVLSCRIPDSMSFQEAAVIPLGLTTAAASLYQDDHLHLTYPSVDPKPLDQTLLIWGGASSVGSNAIQLAVASGYKVITTSSTKNFEFVKKLGASQVFDYTKLDVVEEIVAALKGEPKAGIFDAVGLNAVEKCLEVAAKSDGLSFVSTVLQPPEKVPEGTSAKFVYSTDIERNEVGKAVFERYLPDALAKGKFVAAPDAHVVGKGLEIVQAAFDLMEKGVSAKKLVVTL
ncbi:MAG: hypothetical protein Q9222_004446 [Ikaeria aurantiellina]